MPGEWQARTPPCQRLRRKGHHRLARPFGAVHPRTPSASELLAQAWPFYTEASSPRVQCLSCIDSFVK